MEGNGIKNLLVIWAVVLLAAVGTTLSRGEEQPPKAVAGKELTVDLGGGVKLEMALVPSGEFMMGDKENKPTHKVKITRPFYMGKYEVTQAQWKAVMGTNHSRFKGTSNPVEQVS